MNYKVEQNYNPTTLSVGFNWVVVFEEDGDFRTRRIIAAFYEQIYAIKFAGALNS